MVNISRPTSVLVKRIYFVKRDGIKKKRKRNEIEFQSLFKGELREIENIFIFFIVALLDGRWYETRKTVFLLEGV